MRSNTYRELVEEIQRKPELGKVAEALGLKVDYKGERKLVLCPFHEDHIPSMQLFEDHYHCWACNAHGDVFELVKQLNNLTFKEAVKWLAEFRGLRVPGYSIKSRQLPGKFRSGLKFGYALYKKKAKDSTLKEWCRKRKIDYSTVKDSGILSLDRNPLTSEIEGLSSKYSSNEWGALVDAGLVKFIRPTKYKKDGKTFLDYDSLPKDVFWYRSILFPIYDQYKNHQGLAARVNEDKDYKGPKYLYNRGFKRSENLYGIDKVFENSRNTLAVSKKESGLKKPFDLFITEGFMDALRLRSLGFNAAAVLGSAVSGKIDDSNSQLGLLKKLADTLKDIPLAIHLFLDNDKAGHNGMHRALSQLIELRNKSDNVVHFDIILPGSEYSGKDPDELLKDVSSKDEAYNLLKSWSRPVLDFVITFILDCHIDELESEWEKLTALQEAQLKHRIKFSIPRRNDTLCESTFKENKSKDTPWKKLYLEEYLKDQEIRHIEILETKSKISEYDFQKALMLAEQNYTGPDFPVDFGSWERLKKAGSLLNEELNEHLKNGDLLEPCIPLFMPRDGGGSPRLLVLPCVEDLVLQEYVLNKLLTFAINNDGTIPAVIHKPDLDKGGNLITVGRKDCIPANGKTVSFAYQVNASALRAGGGIETTTFRHFSQCWRSFNDFILERISNSPQEVLFPARLDIRRFYDRIPQYVIVNVLKPALEEACRKALNSPLVPGIDFGDNIDDRATQIVKWICRNSFQYNFYSPENGSHLEWHESDRGIPQGPNLSAWLANIVLFPVDRRLSEEIEKINEEYRSEHPGCSEKDIVATYARYVDDVILIAPDNNTLVRLKQVYASELDKIGLTLSPKIDPMEPQKVTELREWLMENRGFGEKPSGPWVPSYLRVTGSAFKNIWVQTIDRREALALMHDQDIDSGGFSKEDIRHILETVCQKSEEMRYRDYRQVSKRLWQMVSDEFNVNSKPIKIVEKYKEEWEDLIEQDEEEESAEDSNKGTIIDNYSIPLKKTWHLQVCLEGIQALLISRIDKAQFIDDEYRNIHAERRIKMAEWVLKGLINHLIKEIVKEDKYIDKFKFTLKLRKLALIQIAAMVTGKKDFNSRIEEEIEDGIKKALNAITRFSYRSLKPENFEFSRTYTASDKLRSILLFHEVIERLCFGDNNAEDPLSSIRESCEKYHKKQGTLLANALFYLCPLNDIDRNVSCGKESNAIFAALQVFANCVSVDRQLDLLQNRHPLISCLLNNNNKKLYILPHPEGLKLRTIQVIEISEDSKITNRYLLFKTESNNDQDIQNILNDTLPETGIEWTIKENNTCMEGIQCYSQEDMRYSLPILKYIPQKKDLQKLEATTLEKISILYDAFNDLVKISYIDRYLITPFHIVKDENAYSLFSPQYDLLGELRTFAFASENYSGLISSNVPAENAHLWRIGVALSGLLDLFKESSKLANSRIQRDPVNSSDRVECLGEALLRQALYILKGERWWSKPKPVDEAEAKDMPVQTATKLPRAVEDCLNNLKRFLDFENFEEKFAIWLISSADSFLITLCHDIKHFQAAGGFVHICSKLTEQVLYANVFILKELAAFSIVGNDYSDYRRSVACCLKMIETLEGLDEKVKNKESKESLRKLKAAFRIKAINNHFKSLALELRRKANTTFANCFNSLQQDLDIFELDNEVLLSDQLETNSDQLQLYENLDKYLEKCTVSAKGIASITPAGWIVAAWTMLCFILQGEQKPILKELREEIRKVYERLVFCSSMHDGNYPWLIDGDSLKDIEKSFEETLINEKALSKRIDDLASFKLKFCHSNRKPIADGDGKEYFTFSTMEAGDWNLKPWQINIEILPGDKQDKFENESDEEKRVIYWTETWHTETLVSVSLLTESYGKLFHRGDSKSDTNEQDKSITAGGDSKENEDDKNLEQEKVDELEERETSVPGEDEAQPVDVTEKTSHKDVGKYSLEEFKKWQEILWNGRKHRFGRHIRVALCQLNVDESYSHPLREICEWKNKEIDEELKKKNLTITELKNNPWKYDKNLGLEYTKKGMQPKKMTSCAEYRRRMILDEAFRACKHFKVDLLLLPEYSVRPETVVWIKDQLTSDRYSDIPLTVWCGTYRLPYRDGGREDDGKEIGYMTAPIHVISRDDHFVRWKKYPAVAFAEFFKPYPYAIEPLHRSKIGKVSDKRYYPGDYVSELICSENFALTSPANRNAIVQAYYQLEHFWERTTGGTDLERIKKTLDKDLELWSRWSSLSPTMEDKDELDWLKYTPRRTVLFVPAMTSRAADYHILGQANLLAAGICTVFCNAVGEHHDGGSCFIGHGSWSDRHNSCKYYDDRLGPYNGIFPGIYRRDQKKNDGALGHKDQALVIADIDPVYMNEGKPRQQLLQHPLQLVAHLPIIEVSDNQQDNSKKNEVDCACKRERQDTSKLNDILHDAVKIKKIFEEQKIDHMPKVTISDFLKKLSATFNKKDSWLGVREDAYNRYSMTKPSNLPSPAIYDWLVVFSDIKDSSIEAPLIQVPPFTYKKDIIEKR